MTLLTDQAEEAFNKLKAIEHKHTVYGRTDTVGNKECEICRPVIELAVKAENEAKYITRANRINSKIQPCEVCGKDHENYECCHDCNYNTHTCHFCGDDLGHTEVSSCYILMD